MATIDDLPEDMLHQIIFFMPPKDAARTTILSKSWLSAWKSLPVGSFELCDEVKKKNALVKFVDESTSIFHIFKTKVQRFKLVLESSYSRYPFHVQKWITLATRNPIQELHVQVGRSWLRFCRMPQTTFACESLVILKLKGCELRSSLLHHNPMFISLQKLNLGFVHLDSAFLEKLISCCPFLTRLILKDLVGIDSIQVHNLPQLTKATILPGVFGVKIEMNTPSLHTLKLSLVGREDVINCHQLIKFTLDLLDPNANSTFISEFLSRFPILEDLSISFITYRESVMKISGLTNLERLKLYANCEFNRLEMNIDSPDLHFYGYEGNRIPASNCVNLLGEGQVNLHLRCRDANLNTLWFLSLRKHISSFKASTIDLKLNFRRSQVALTFIPMLLDKSFIPPPKCLEELVFDDVFPNLDYRALVEGLLWSCYPRKMKIKTKTYMHRKFTEILLATVMDRDENPVCCRSLSNFSCWRHYLKEVDIKLETDNGENGFIMCPKEQATLKFLIATRTDLKVMLEMKWTVEW